MPVQAELTRIAKLMKELDAYTMAIQNGPSDRLGETATVATVQASNGTGRQQGSAQPRIADALRELVAEHYRLICRDPSHRRGGSSCKRDHSWQLSPATPFAAFDVPMAELALWVALSQHDDAIAIVDRKRGPSFVLALRAVEAGRYEALIRANHILLDHHCFWNPRLAGPTREVPRGLGKTPDEAIEQLTNHLKMLVLEELAIRQLLADFKAEYRRKFLPQFADHYPHFEVSTGTQLRMGWAQRARNPEKRRWVSATGANQIEALSRALAGQFDCNITIDRSNPCTLGIGHKGDCLRANPAQWRTA